MMKQTKVAAAVATALGSLSAGQSVAQQPLEEIVVTGIRGSLTNAMDVKRDSSGIVDAISAEDIGKFPDTNLAESLQRITGVSINRINGEGSEVTVRGFGPQFNLVTLNGRQMPAANVATIGSNNIGTDGNSRSFDFSNLASEGVTGLQVYKTGRAAAPSGGIGATLNVQTLRPLGAVQQFVVGGKAVNDTGGDGTTGELSGLASWSNDDDTLGVSVFGSSQTRNSSTRAYNSANFIFGRYSPTASSFRNAEQVNEPELGSLFAYPRAAEYFYETTERERTNGMLTLQYAASDRLLITADALYASTTMDSSHVMDSLWFSRQFERIEWDGNPVVATPVLLTEFIGAEVGKDFAFRNRDLSTQDELTSFGINFDYAFSDDLSVSFDVAMSDAMSGGNGAAGKNDVRAQVAGAVTGWQSIYYGGDIPVATAAIADGNGDGDGLFEAGDLGAQVVSQAQSDQEANIDQFQLAGAWDDGGPIMVDFGLSHLSTMMRQTRRSGTDHLGGWGVSNTGEIPLELIEQRCTACEFQDHTITGVPNAQSLAPAGSSLVNLGSVTYATVPSATGYAIAMEGHPLYPNWDFETPRVTSIDDNVIEEDITSAYVEATMDGTVGDMPMQVVAGLRYETTDVFSSSVQNVIDRYVWASDNDFSDEFTEGAQNVVETYSYGGLLPNLDFSIDVNDEMKVRASFSKTIARPEYGHLFVLTETNNPDTPTYLGGTATASKGNAALDPLESDNFDLSFEWYYGESSYFSVGYYQKAVSNFVGTEQVSQSLFGIRDVSTGRPGTLSGDAVAALEAGGYDVNEQNLFTMTAVLDNPQDFSNGAADFRSPEEDSAFAFDVLGQYDVEPRSNDPLMIFATQQPVNNETANIDGLELAWQHFFGDTGFGIHANATIVNNDVEFDVAGDPDVDQFALEGLSDSANLVLVYENDILGVRVAYNWRDAFLDDTNRRARVPLFIEEFEQLDLNVSWNATDALTVSLDGINLIEQGTRGFGRTRNMITFINEADARWMLSARYQF